MKRGGRGPGPSRALLAVSALSLAAFLALAVGAARHQLSDLDHATRALVQSTRLPLLDLAMIGVSGLGDNYGLIPLIALAVAILWRPSRRWAVALPLLMAGTGVLQLVAKWAIDRPRPSLGAWGFPSGHVLSVGVFVGLMICWRRRRPCRARAGGSGTWAARRSCSRSHSAACTSRCSGSRTWRAGSHWGSRTCCR